MSYPPLTFTITDSEILLSDRPSIEDACYAQLGTGAVLLGIQTIEDPETSDLHVSVEYTYN